MASRMYCLTSWVSYAMPVMYAHTSTATSKPEHALEEELGTNCGNILRLVSVGVLVHWAMHAKVMCRTQQQLAGAYQTSIVS